MLVFYLVIFCSLLFGLKTKSSGFFDDFLERRQTDAVKGLFILLVFCRHALQVTYDAGFRPENGWDALGYRLCNDLGQLVVVMFLFYSGYGVMESVQKKGKPYLDSFPRRRILNTLLNFDVAVLVFVALNLVMGKAMSLKQIGCSLFAWDSVGNSNWYIFVVLLCYLVTWISGRVFPNGGWKMVALTSALVLAGEAFLSILKHGEQWWYNTMLCYPAGMCLSLFKDRFTRIAKRYYLPVFGLLLAVFLFLHFQRWIPAFRGLTYNVHSIAFALLVILATMKVKTGNRFLCWAGTCVFPLYIYQRLPMRVFRYWPGDAWVCANPYVFFLLCAGITGIIACLYKYWQIKLK